MTSPADKSVTKSSTVRLGEGLYDQILDSLTQAHLPTPEDPRLRALFGNVDPGESHSVLAQYLERLILRGLSNYRGTEKARQQLTVAQKILDLLHSDLANTNDTPLSIASPLQRLLAIHSIPVQPPRPNSPLARSTLITGARSELKLGTELAHEIRSAESVDILCSFILWSGLRVVLDALRELTGRPPLPNNQPRLRIITTSYMGHTEIKAVKTLLELPRTLIRVNYDTKHGRLHAKAYLIHRPTGFGSAYIGSANLSKSALSEGLEWTTKISQYELPHLWSKITHTFDAYWLDAEFQLLTQTDLPTLEKVLAAEKCGQLADNQLLTFIDVAPYPFQQEILDILLAERTLGKNQHLVVAATGTGKTMIAAFDYQNFCEGNNPRPSLLFIAHREEILCQALNTFRVVLRDQNFGDLVVGGSDETSRPHLFCSIQSFHSRSMLLLAAEKFDYVVVDEFHHAAASSYQALLQHVKPRVLLGLTATPERTDNLDILQWFGGRPSAEIRLPDAINRDLLVSFQYFGVSDSVDLSTLDWQHGGYKLAELDHILSSNSSRAGLVIDKVNELLLDPFEARALGFCVSIEHAKYMAEQFIRCGFKAASLSSQSSAEARRTIQQRLVNKEINFLFVVDLYNEGVDIPAIDTVLFLRPTESLTVFLQQLGRGLRKFKGKQCLTVLDFIAAHRREYRFAARFRAMITDRTASLRDQLEDDFTCLPAGCIIRLERVARERVLENITQSLANSTRSIILGIKDYFSIHGRPPGMLQAADFLATDLAILCKRGLWTRLLAEARLVPAFVLPEKIEGIFSDGLHRASHWDDPEFLRTILVYLEQGPVSCNLPLKKVMLHQFLATVLGKTGESLTFADADTLVRQYEPIRESAKALVQALLPLAHPGTQPFANLNIPLTLHCQYTRDEILLGLGRWTFTNRPSFREGVLHLPEKKMDIFFVTLQKTEKDYSPTTLYEDFALSPCEFHWQTQSQTSVQSETGQRYLRHHENGYSPLLFVREKNTTSSGRRAPYYFLGPCHYLRHTGSKPISIVWKLATPMPARLFRQVGLEGVA